MFVFEAEQRQKNVPTLEFPHPTRISDGYFAVKPLVHDWFIATGVFEGARLRRFLLGDYTLFVAMMHSHSDRERLERLTRYYILWFAMEEYCESLWSAEPGRADRFLRGFVAHLETGVAPEASDPWLDAFVGAVEGLGLNARQRELLATWMIDWLRGEQRVAAYRGEPREEFMLDRFHTIGQHLAFRLFTQYELGLDLPPAVSERPDMVEFVETLVRAGSWHSDVLTLEAEEARGELVNTVHVIARRPGSDRERGIRDIVRRFHEDCRLASAQAERLLKSDWGDTPREDVAAYVDALFGTSAGFLSWNQITDRYVVPLQ
ncbi:terpene synthase family protein (plasmid) [Streptomyces sp. BI20]|uniref:terpene synthase family protein n=1 Tax=Streptomyces sp. BI20 TaxID=3403460 RepID=UPI003C77EE06